MERKERGITYYEHVYTALDVNCKKPYLDTGYASTNDPFPAPNLKLKLHVHILKGLFL